MPDLEDSSEATFRAQIEQIADQLCLTVGGRFDLLVTVDGEDVGWAELPLFMRMMSSVGASVGYDHGSAVSGRYRAPNHFLGTLHEVVIQLAASRAAGTDEAGARAEQARQ